MHTLTRVSFASLLAAQVFQTFDGPVSDAIMWALIVLAAILAVTKLARDGVIAGKSA